MSIENFYFLSKNELNKILFGEFGSLQFAMGSLQYLIVVLCCNIVIY
jgi:hypothetical protein